MSYWYEMECEIGGKHYDIKDKSFFHPWGRLGEFLIKRKWKATRVYIYKARPLFGNQLISYNSLTNNEKPMTEEESIDEAVEEEKPIEEEA